VNDTLCKFGVRHVCECGDSGGVIGDATLSLSLPNVIDEAGVCGCGDE